MLQQHKHNTVNCYALAQAVCCYCATHSSFCQCWPSIGAGWFSWHLWLGILTCSRGGPQHLQLALCGVKLSSFIWFADVYTKWIGTIRAATRIARIAVVVVVIVSCIPIPTLYPFFSAHWGRITEPGWRPWEAKLPGQWNASQNGRSGGKIGGSEIREQ